ncbi:hypothetical protein L3X38_032675 [Prunus dulcis]|uniref:Uncharacterized protein n=1 Tax=Prunus dulcis TaxID=3755 RepID=A0AAD4YWV2_PRUDU|nr:hypothetical protein L3X38_032675 [Prunus dulcis]
MSLLIPQVSFLQRDRPFVANFDLYQLEFRRDRPFAVNLIFPDKVTTGDLSCKCRRDRPLVNFIFSKKCRRVALNSSSHKWIWIGTAIGAALLVMVLCISSYLLRRKLFSGRTLAIQSPETTSLGSLDLDLERDLETKRRGHGHGGGVRCRQWLGVGVEGRGGEREIGEKNGGSRIEEAEENQSDYWRFQFLSITEGYVLFVGGAFQHVGSTFL